MRLLSWCGSIRTTPALLTLCAISTLQPSPRSASAGVTTLVWLILSLVAHGPSSEICCYSLLLKASSGYNLWQGLNDGELAQCMTALCRISSYETSNPHTTSSSLNRAAQVKLGVVKTTRATVCGGRRSRTLSKPTCTKNCLVVTKVYGAPRGPQSEACTRVILVKGGRDKSTGQIGLVSNRKQVAGRTCQKGA
jgi:hypothetical protein